MSPRRYLAHIHPLRRSGAVACVVLAVLAVLAGCSRTEDPPPASAVPAVAASAASAAGSVANGVQAAGGAASGPVAHPVMPGPLKAAWVYPGSVNDAGGTAARERARKAVAAEFGAQLESEVVQRVRTPVESERVLRRLATAGQQLIFATAPDHSAAVRKLAPEFPDVQFELAQGDRPGDNVGVAVLRTEEAAYIAGTLAGAQTRSGLLGYVGSAPTPATLRELNAYALGARSTHARARVRVTWTRTSFDPEREASAAQALIAAGADVLMQGTDSIAAMQAAERAGRRAIGWASDMGSHGPSAHLASIVIDWSPHYRRAIRQVLEGRWQAERHSTGFKEGAVRMTMIGSTLDASLRERLDQLTSSAKAGQLHPFVGPLTDARGRVRLGPGARADAGWLDGMDFLVPGIEETRSTSK